MTTPAHENTQEYWQRALMGKTLVDGPVAESEAATTFAKSALPNPHRVVPPGSFVTMDFRPERLNVTVDAGMRVTRVHYG
ncbi:hypothetical protein H9P43_004498 [Blastocladiella emersonii ATCC 22665]|nr:hypothetical protein H9P43_004498 [Blastocladiella emersonii ATCC 22665]